MKDGQKSEEKQGERKKVEDEEDMGSKAERKRQRRRERERKTRVILELARFPGRRKTPRRSKPQSDKRSRPTDQ